MSTGGSYGRHTFNLVFTKKKADDEVREVFFIFRERGFTRLPGIENEFAGCEAGGNIIIENLEEYERFPGEIERLELVNGAGQPAKGQVKDVYCVK
jgi:hypothetical protein